MTINCTHVCTHLLSGIPLRGVCITLLFLLLSVFSILQWPPICVCLRQLSPGLIHSSLPISVLVILVVVCLLFQLCYALSGNVLSTVLCASPDHVILYPTSFLFMRVHVRHF